MGLAAIAEPVFRTAESGCRLETFGPLRFTHTSPKPVDRRFLLMRHTMRKRLHAKLVEIKQTLYRTSRVCGTWSASTNVPASSGCCSTAFLSRTAA
jgi:hypothetical protein